VAFWQSTGDVTPGTARQGLTHLDDKREPLEVFLCDPSVPLSDNDGKRGLRYVVVGRCAEWLAFASPRGGQVA